MDVELLYNSVKTRSQTVGVLEMRCGRDVVGMRCGRESHTRLKGSLEPLMSWGPQKLLIRCSRESQQSEPWASG